MTTKYFIRKLTSLNYPDPENFDVSDYKQFRFVVAWLENRFICHYEEEERTNLNNYDNPEWIMHYDKYLEDLKVPFKSSDCNESLDWLLGLAIQNVYKDKNKKMDLNKMNGHRSDETSLDNLDMNSEEFKAGVYELASILGIPQHPDHIRVLKACSLLIVEKLSEANATKANEMKLDVMNIDQVSAGFNNNNDNDLKRIVASLRLIHMYNLRKLQMDINTALVTVQEMVADPITNEKLGKVGF